MLRLIKNKNKLCCMSSTNQNPHPARPRQEVSQHQEEVRYKNISASARFPTSFPLSSSRINSGDLMATLSSISLLLLEFILIHYHCGATEDCKVTVTQDKFQETYVSLGTVTLSCSYTATACTDQPDIYWFRYLVSQSETLCTKATCIPRFTAHFTNPGASLAISSLQLNDSAIYVCGIVFTKSKSSTSKATGHGTTVVVRDRALTTECTVLIIICALLLVYSIAVFAVYAFLNWSKLKLFIHTKKGEDLTQEDPSKSYRRRRIFQAIAQELYHKRYAGNSRGQSHVPEDDTIYQNT